MTAIAAGGWVAILAIVVICLIGLIVASPFGIFFSGEDSGTGQTMPTVVREINQEYEGKLGEIESSAAHDRLELSGSRAVWPEVLAVYAVKTTTDPDNPQEVATMDDGKKRTPERDILGHERDQPPDRNGNHHPKPWKLMMERAISLWKK